MSFKDYKKNRVTSLDDLVKQAEAVNTAQKSFEADPNDWYPTTDKAGNASVVIRFLPAREDEDQPFVRRWSHSFKEPSTGLWYIENCLSTISTDYNDPVMHYNTKLFNKAGGKDAPEDHPLRKQASRQKRNVEYRSNLWIIGDSHKPDANSTLKRWKYGQGTFNEIMKAMKPPVIEGAVDQEDPINPFDLIEGANLRITITTDPTKKQNGKPVRSYAYKWLKPGPLGSDEMMEKLWDELNEGTTWSLKKFVAPDQFKSYEELHKRLTKVMGFDPLADGAPVTKPVVLAGRTAAPQALPTASAAQIAEDSLPWDQGAPAPSQGAGDPDGDWFASLETKE